MLRAVLSCLALLLLAWTCPAAATTPVWQTASPMNHARFGHTLTLLPDGRVLAVGGLNNSGYLASAELFDPATEQWTLAANSSSSTRYFHTATLLPTGKVLIVGGRQSYGGVASTHDLFDPATLRFEPANSSIGAMEGHAAVRLTSGEVWLDHQGTIWIYHPGQDRWSLGPGWQPTGSRPYSWPYVAERLGSDQVVVSLGIFGTEIYSLSTGAVTQVNGGSVPINNNEGNYAFLRRPNGSVLAAWQTHSALITAGGSVTTTPYPEFRNFAPLVDSELGPLLIGGWEENYVKLSSTRHFDGASWQTGPVLNEARARASAIRLADGRVLVSGGQGNTGGYGSLTSTEILGAPLADPADLVLEPLFEETGFGTHRVRLKVRHNGLGSTAQSVALALQLDAGLTLDSATPTAGSFDAVQSRWTLGTLNVGASAELVLDLHFADTSQAATLGLDAQLSASAGNLHAGNDDARINLRLRLPDVELSHSAMQFGSELRFTLDVMHNGAVALPFSALETYAQLPAGLTFVAAMPSQGQYDPLNQRWNVGALAPGASAQLLVRASVDVPDQAAHFALLAALWSSTPADAEAINNSATAEIDYTPLTHPATLGGRVWFDVDGNGREDAGEQPLMNHPVFLLAAGAPLGVTMSDGNGEYRFSNLPPGFYDLQLGLPPNQNDGNAWLPSARVATGDPGNDNNLDGSQPLPLQAGLIRYPLGSTVTLVEGQQVLDVDAGLHRGVSLSGRVWKELDSLGSEDQGEPGVFDLPVVMLRGGVEIARTSTDADGRYRFLGVACACTGTTFDLELQLPELDLRALSPTGAVSDPNTDSNFETALVGAVQVGRLPLAAVGIVEQRAELDAGLRRGRVRGQVWADVDGDGIRESGEGPIGGVRVVLIDAINQVRGDVTTDQNGRYALDDVRASEYRLSVQLPFPSSGAVTGPTRWNQGLDDSLDSDFAGDQPVPANLLPGATRGFYSAAPPDLLTNGWNDTVDAGLHPGTTISGTVWKDLAPLGTREDSEAPLGGVELQAEFDSGAPALQTTTDGAGNYRFEGLNCLCNGDSSVRIRLTVPPLFAAVPVGLGNDLQRDNDFAASGANQAVTTAIALGANLQRNHIDAGLTPSGAELRLKLWVDVDNDGIRDPDEPPALAVPLALYRQGESTPLTQRVADGTEVVFPLSDAGAYRIAWGGIGTLANLATPNAGASDWYDSDFDPANAQGSEVFSPWITLALGERDDSLGLGLRDFGGLLTAVVDGNGQALALPPSVHQPDATSPALTPFSPGTVTGTNTIEYVLYPSLPRTFTVLAIAPQPGRILLGASAGHPAIDPPNWRSHPRRPRHHQGFPSDAYYLSALEAVTFVVAQPQATGTASSGQGTAMNTGSGGNKQLKAVGDYTAVVDVPAGAIEQPTELFLNRYSPGSGAAPRTRWPSGWMPLGVGLLWGATSGQPVTPQQDASAVLLAAELPPLAELALFRYDSASEEWQPLPVACPGRTLQPGIDAGSVMFEACREGWYALFVEGPLFEDSFETQ
ncbi:MAG: hypothetical protein IT478_08705 [Xanthomonadales bacterium]|nr:hypothetical protein [Xanthomonadales bacterium]